MLPFTNAIYNWRMTQRCYNKKSQHRNYTTSCIYRHPCVYQQHRDYSTDTETQNGWLYLHAHHACDGPIKSTPISLFIKIMTCPTTGNSDDSILFQTCFSSHAVQHLAERYKKYFVFV